MIVSPQLREGSFKPAGRRRDGKVAREAAMRMQVEHTTVDETDGLDGNEAWFMKAGR